MAIFKCKMCGGDLEITEGVSVCKCEYCGTKQTLPRLGDDKKANLYDRANHFRRNNEFDKAASIYEQILNEDTTDSESYWSLVLCRYGIEYVEDPATKRRVPTVNRAQFTSIFDDDNYKSAIQYADSFQKAIYEEEANTINEIQKGILSISQKEEPFDVFICYKETDNNGRRTPDSVLANDLYYQLKQEGFKVFFARITLEDKLGTAYEPYIFAALNSAKVMVVLGTKPEYFNAVWVKNEWSRYLALVNASGGKKILIPAYRDMDPYDLPDEFSHLQAQDMSKLGFMQDLIRGIKKIARENDEKNKTANDSKVTGEELSAGVKSLIKRAYIFLEDKEWKNATEYCERVLDIDPENAEAYLGLLLAELNLTRPELLSSQTVSFDQNKNYLKVMRFGSETIKAEIANYSKRVNDYLDEQSRIQKEREEAERVRKQQEADRIERERIIAEQKKQKEISDHLNKLRYMQKRAIQCKRLVSRIKRDLVAVKPDGTIYTTSFGNNLENIESVFGEVAITFSGEVVDIIGYYSSNNVEIATKRLEGKKVLQCFFTDNSNYICLSEDGVIYSSNKEIDQTKNIVYFSAIGIKRGLLLTADGKVIGFGLSKEESTVVSCWKNISMVNCSKDLVGGLTNTGEIQLTRINASSYPLPAEYIKRHNYYYKATEWKNIIDFVFLDKGIYGLDENGYIKVAEEYDSINYFSGYKSNKKVIALVDGWPPCAIYDNGTLFYGWSNKAISDYKETYQKWKLFNSFETLDEERKQAQEKLAIMKQHRTENRCQYCGGEFKGVILKKCINCGKSKDY